MMNNTMIKFILYIVGVICSCCIIVKILYKESIKGLTVCDLFFALLMAMGSWVTFFLFISDKILVVKKNNKKK